MSCSYLSHSVWLTVFSSEESWKRPIIHSVSNILWSRQSGLVRAIGWLINQYNHTLDKTFCAFIRVFLLSTSSMSKSCYLKNSLFYRKWRLDLMATCEYWESWFKGISQKFLTSRVGSGGKVLVLVGHDHLDKDLTIGHMQGRYQLLIIPKSGHVIEVGRKSMICSC